MSDFAHLHVHTQYSLLDGSAKIGELVGQAKALGMKSLAITDHGVMYGAIDFYKECLNQQIHPIIGCEVYVTRSRFQKDGRADAEYNHLVLLAENNQGYQNLIALVSRGFIEGFYYKPRIDWELLCEYHEGLIALSACLAGVIPRPILDEGYDKACEAARRYSELFGPDHFYLELQNHGIAEEAVVNQSLIRMSKELSLPLVCTNDVHYTFADDKEAHDLLLCIQTGKKVTDENRMRYEGDYYLKSPEEMEALFGAVPEALENTVRIAERCQVSFKFHDLKLPAFPVPEGFTTESYLRELCREGLEDRYPADSPLRRTAEERMQYELGVIAGMGYVEYFLIVWDFIHFAKTHGIMVGPGRGSGAGSIVAYCLRITNIDPLRYDLIFERFLNPERVSMPDIDVDFCDRRRQDVIDYVVQKYGKDQVAQIVTFGTMKAKLVIRDVARVMDLPYADADRIAKMIPNELGITIDKALEINKEFKAVYDDDPQIRKLVDMSRRLEGLPRHCSTHASGVVISRTATMEYVPLMANDGVVSTQYTMTTLEELGLLKMDFLGLRTETVIEDAVMNAYKTEGVRIVIDEIPTDDAGVYRMIGAGQTSGVFQLESPGMTSFMKELRPESLEDVIAGISLYRPGPMDFIPKYIEGKKNPARIRYKTPLLEPILDKTYGCIVYQEQVMQIVRDLAGYTMGRSDLVRRAMAKKKAEVMAKERQNFVYGSEEEQVPGCASRGIPAAVAESIFDEMTDFAKYAFNKSHAAAYAVVAYETAWLKYHYPVEYMAAIMSSVIDAPDKLIHYIQTLKEMDIELLPPDINKSCDDFSVERNASGKKCIRYALSAIRNVGHSCIAQLEKDRTENGPFSDIYDFCRRMLDFDLNKRALENLIKAGAFDCLGGQRSQYMAAYPTALSAAATWKKSMISGQIDLFGFGDPGPGQEVHQEALPRVPEYPEGLRLGFEKEALGIYLSGHPLAQFEELWRKTITNFTTDLYFESADEGEENGGRRLADGQIVTLGGILTQKTVKATKNNNMMAFITLEDLYGSVEVLIFPNIYEEMREYLTEDARLFVKGRVSVADEENSKLIAQSLAPFDNPELLEKAVFSRGPRRIEPRTLWLQLQSAADWEARQAEICRILSEDAGPHAVKIFLKEEKQRLQAPDSLKTWAKPATRAKLGKLLGESNVILQ